MDYPTRQQNDLSTEFQEVLKKAKDYSRHSKAANTAKSYRADRKFPNSNPPR